MFMANINLTYLIINLQKLHKILHLHSKQKSFCLDYGLSNSEK